MIDREKITFTIDHLDPLAQGVDKSGTKVTFIPKTLPGEQGTCEIIKSVKTVRFAQLLTVDKTSPLRKDSECPHFANCSGCDYLHTDYPTELNFKAATFERIFKSFEPFNFKIHHGKNRFHYRNRIQLHYDKKKKLLGFFKEKTNIIHEVPSCMIANAQVQKMMGSLYKDNHWLNLAKAQPDIGHVEIYNLKNETHLNWNTHYAKQGFTQVNQPVNEMIINQLSSYAAEHFDAKIPVFDLFSGDGNLVKNLKDKFKIFHFDNFKHTQENFHQVDLFDESNIDQFKKLLVGPMKTNFIIDPPRSGFKNILNWVKLYKPEHIIYVSCDPQTLKRDLLAIKGIYQTESLQLFDLFPGSRHFESMAFCRKL